MFSLQAKQTFSFYTKQRTGGGSLSGIKLPESISTEQLEEQPQNLKLLLLGFSSPHRSSGFFPDQCFFFPGEQGLQCLSLGSSNYLLQSEGQQHEAPSNAAQPLLSLPRLHALQTKWSRQVPLHCRMSPKKSWGIPRKLSAPRFALCGGTYLGFYHWPCRNLLSICTLLLTGNVSGQTMLPTFLGIKKKKKSVNILTMLLSLFFRFFYWNSICWLSTAFCFMEAARQPQTQWNLHFVPCKRQLMSCVTPGEQKWKGFPQAENINGY